MKTFLKYLLFAMVLVVGSCDERVIGLDDSELVTISEESLNYNITGGYVYINNYNFPQSGIVLLGSTIVVQAVPEYGYEFIGWFIGDSNEPVSTEPYFTFIAGEDIDLFAKFEKSFAISVKSSGNGTVSFKDIEETSLNNVLKGTELTAIAVPDENYEFIGWFDGDSNEPVSTDATYTFIVKENVSLVAKFNKWPLVSICSGGNGSVSFENSSDLSQYIQPGSEVTIVAVPDGNYDFLGWYIGDSNELVSTEATYTFTVNENITLKASFDLNYNGHEYVDLGLPSGIKWATCNVGANSPEEHGGYYAWGETEEKEDYSWSTYKWCNDSGMTKYCTDSNYGIVDNKTVLDPEDDVAHVKWGGDWRMPTEAELDELRENCTWREITLDGVRGFRVTGPNGNSIFLPNASWKGWISDDMMYRGDGFYWSSSSLGNSGAYILEFWSGNYQCSSSSRYLGQSVRPVCK